MKWYSILVCSHIIFMGCKDPSASKTDMVEVANTQTTASQIQTKTKPEKSTAKHSASKDTQDDWYWKNTQMSINNSFRNWEHGHVDLFMVYRYKNNETFPEKIKVGNIDGNGTITINLPETIETETKVSDIANLVFYDIQDMATLSSHNPTAGYFGKTTLKVLKDGVVIGTLTLGNSVRVTYNLTNQSTLTMGDEGYLISWAYLDKAASLKGTEKTKNKVRRDGTNTVEAENTVVYDLDYKSGWNFVKTEVIGKYDLEHERNLNASWFKRHEHRVISEIPEDAAYFFRKLSN